MELAPSTYRCATHEEDLTELVREQLAEQVPVAYRRHRPREFRVVVRCLGASGHELACTGRVTY